MKQVTSATVHDAFGEDLHRGGPGASITVWAGEEGDPEEVFRRVPGIEATDEFKPPKYPGSPQYSSIDRMVIRDGSVVARLMGPGIGPTWDLLINACPDSGIVPD